jgi:hypothetical protein
MAAWRNAHSMARGKVVIRNSKTEIRSKFEYSNSKNWQKNVGRKINAFPIFLPGHFFCRSGFGIFPG